MQLFHTPGSSTTQIQNQMGWDYIRSKVEWEISRLVVKRDWRATSGRERWSQTIGDSNEIFLLRYTTVVGKYPETARFLVGDSLIQVVFNSSSTHISQFCPCSEVPQQAKTDVLKHISVALYLEVCNKENLIMTLAKTLGFCTSEGWRKIFINECCWKDGTVSQSFKKIKE